MTEYHDLTNDQKLLIADKFLKDETFDVNIVLDNGVAAKANKIVLATESTYFKAKLGTIDVDELRLNVRASKTSLDLVLKYFYTGQMILELDVKELLILLNLLKFLDIDSDDVHAFTVSKMRENMTSNLKMVSNFKEVEYLAPELLEMILTEFLHPRNDEKKEASSDDNSTAEDHCQCFQIFFNWMQGNVDADFTFKRRISKMFDLSKFDSKLLLKEAKKSKLFTDQEIIDVLGKRDEELTLLKSENKDLSCKLSVKTSENKAFADANNNLQSEIKDLHGRLLARTSRIKALTDSNYKLKRELDVAVKIGTDTRINFKRLSTYNAGVIEERDDAMMQLEEVRMKLDEAVNNKKFLDCRVLVKKMKLDKDRA